VQSGDANLEKGNNEEALNYYMKAVDWDKNQFTAAIFLLKAATVKEIQNDYKGATDLYERIRKIIHKVQKPVM
jgi:tetratricopeptide (TPR) repeat protein